jgi:hypothetical protein
VRAFRPNSAAEWMRIWPITQERSTPYIQANRRLFRSYEPFMNARLVKAAAAIPVEWKLNRRLFSIAMRPLWGRLGWIPHSECHLPVLHFWANLPVSFAIGGLRQARRVLHLEKHMNHNPWSDANAIVATDCFRALVGRFRNAFEGVSGVFSVGHGCLLEEGSLTADQMFRFLQLLWTVDFHHRPAATAAACHTPAIEGR